MTLRTLTRFSSIPCLLALMWPLVEINAQIQDILELSTSELQNFNTLSTQDDDVFGYAANFLKEELSSDSSRYEYVILDKNLNEIVRNEFIAIRPIEYYYGKINDQGQILLIPKKKKGVKYGRQGVGMLMTMRVDLENNEIYEWHELGLIDSTIAPQKKYKTYAEFRADPNQKCDEDKCRRFTEITLLKYGELLLIQNDSYKSHLADYRIQKWSSDGKKMLWNTFMGGQNGTYFFKLTPLLFTENRVYFKKTTFRRAHERANEFIMYLNLETGDQLNEIELKKEIEFYDWASVFLNTNSYENEDIILMKSMQGFFRLRFNRFGLDYDWEKLEYSSFSHNFPKLSIFGKMKKGYFLLYRASFFQPDGSLFLLCEQSKLKSMFNYEVANTNNFHILELNNDFELITMNSLMKKPSKYNEIEFVFSQKLDENGGMAFIYKNTDNSTENEPRHGIEIGTIIDRKIRLESVKLTDSNKSIFPFAAKKGYIGLLELDQAENKSQFRLEKLNY